MKTFTRSLLSFVLAFAAAGCSGGTRLVRGDRLGGSVALQGPFMLEMGAARLLMAQHCKGRFDALERPGSVEFSCRSAGGATASAAVPESEHSAL